MPNSAHITICEKTLVDLLAEAIAKRIARDYDTFEDCRTPREMLRDTIQDDVDADLRKYLLEMLNGDHELSGCYHITIEMGV